MRAIQALRHSSLLSAAQIASDKPIIYKALGKAAIYSLACFLLRSAEHRVRYYIKYKSWSSAWEHSKTQEIWQLFLTIQIWYFLLFFLFVAAQELIRRIGTKEFMKMYFGRTL